MKNLLIYILLLLILVIYLPLLYIPRISHENQKEKVFLETEDIVQIAEPARQKVENVIQLDGQPMYYAYVTNPKTPSLIIYSKGEYQRITTDKNNPQMHKMMQYGDFFAQHGYIFSVSNQHDDNMTLEDIQNTLDYFSLDTPIYMIGFSMGAVTTMNYALENSERIAAIALLAPTPMLYLTKSDVDKLQDIPIKIFHGDMDVNIFLKFSYEYVRVFEKHGKFVDFQVIEGGDHYSVETGLMEEIYEFFTTSTTDTDSQNNHSYTPNL